eukprot:12531375-Alexandrium_andersonii.AAC.1
MPRPRGGGAGVEATAPSHLVVPARTKVCPTARGHGRADRAGQRILVWRPGLSPRRAKDIPRSAVQAGVVDPLE